MLTLDDFYAGNCDIRVSCPQLVRWYSIDGSIEDARASLVAELERAGKEPQPKNFAHELITMLDDDHFFFITFGKEFRSSDSMIPSHVEVDIAVSPMPDFEGASD